MKSKKLKKLLAFTLATAMLFSDGMMSQVFAEEGTIDDETTVHAAGTSSGECGENLTWTLEDGTLTISGSGDMYNYDYYGNPWKGYEFYNVIIEEGVTSIGASAFDGCSSLSSISIPEGVTSIGKYAFRDCYNITEIELPKGVTSIGSAAFYYCYTLTSIKIPKEVTNIADSAFGHCYALTSIEIPEGVTSIESHTFLRCSSLSSINIPEGVTCIWNSAFMGCNALTSIEIPESVTNIGEEAFSGCSALTSIEIPEGIRYIGKKAFFECEELNSVSLPRSLEEIGQGAFGFSDDDDEGYVSLGDFSIACYAGSIAEKYAINNGIRYILLEAAETDVSKSIVTLSATTYTYDGTAKQPTVVVKLDDETLVKDTDYTVEYTNNINVGTATVTITGKGNYTGSITKDFTITAQNMSKATVTLSESKYTYDGTAKQPAVVVKLNNKTLVKDTDYTVAYKNNTKVGTATVTVTGKGNYTGTVQATFRIIKKTSDSNNSSISINKAKVTLSKATYYFDGKEKTPGVTVKLSGKTLKKNTDYTVSYSKNKNIGTATVTIKGKGSYTGTVKKTFKITVKKGASYTVGAYKYNITSTSAVAFAGIKNTKTTKVVIPKTVKIGGKTFKVTFIASKALYKQTKVTSVTIGENVTSIGKEAFRNCSKLSTITIKSTELKSVGANVFKGIKATVKIKVPSKKLSAYKKLLKGKGQGSKVKITK